MSDKKLLIKSAKAKITEIDQDLSLLRESWLNAKPDAKWKHMRLINRSLDERFEQMKIRDDK